MSASPLASLSRALRVSLGCILLLGAARVVLEVTGTEGDDVIDRNWAGRQDPDLAELVKGLGGRDRLWGYGGADRLTGGGGNDLLYGDEAADSLNGDSDDDQLFGGNGTDVLFGGAGFDYHDGGSGADRLDGGTNEDLLIGREANDSLIGGAGNDFFVIIGNSAGGYFIQGADITGPAYFTNLLFFARDVNPDNFMIVDTMSVQTQGNHYKYARLEFGLRTLQPVTFDINTATNVKNVQAVSTGDGADHVTGSDFTGRYAYDARFRETLGIPHEMYIHEMFFTSGGDDVVETRGGSDFVDAGAGNDQVTIGSGAHRLVLGSGNDVVKVLMADLNGPEASGGAPNVRSTIVYDLSPGDRIEVNGAVAQPDVVFVIGATPGETRVKIKNKEEFILRGVSRVNARVNANPGNGVVITVTQRDQQSSGPKQTVGRP